VQCHFFICFSSSCFRIFELVFFCFPLYLFLLLLSHSFLSHYYLFLFVSFISLYCFSFLFLVVRTSAVDASALDHFKQIADFCQKAKVNLCLSGLEPHLDILVRAGVFKTENRFIDLDTVLCTCEDKLLQKYNIGDEIDVSDSEEELLMRESTSFNSQYYETNSNNDDENENENEKESDNEFIKDIQEHRIEQEKIRSISRKGFLKCLGMLRDRHNISENSMGILELLTEHVRPLRLVEGEIIMHITQGSPVDLDEDGLFFIQVSGRQ
jgi:hypothetical protein